MAKQSHDRDTVDWIDVHEVFMTAVQIKALIKDKGLTQGKLAVTLGIKDNYMSKIINNIEERKRKPNWEYALRWLLR